MIVCLNAKNLKPCSNQFTVNYINLLTCSFVLIMCENKQKFQTKHLKLMNIFIIAFTDESFTIRQEAHMKKLGHHHISRILNMIGYV